MARRFSAILFLLSLAPTCFGDCPSGRSPTSSSHAPRSASLVVGAGDVADAVINSDSRSVTFLKPDGEVCAEVIVGRQPRNVTFNGDGSLALVSNRLDDTISVIETATFTVARTIETCDEPEGLLALPDGRALLVCGGSAQLVVLDPVAGAESERVDVEATPRGMLLDQARNRIYISHFSSGRVSVLDTDTLEIEAVVSTGPDSNLANGMALSPDGSRLYLPHTRSNADNPSPLFDTTVFPVVSVIDLDSLVQIPSERLFLDISDEPVGIPWDAVVTDDGRIFILNAASNDLSVIELATGRGLAHIEVGHHPTGLALSPDGRQVLVNNSLSGSRTVIDADSYEILEEHVVTDIALTRALLNGKRLFNSSDRTDLARDQWIACSTCHFDGEADGRTWFFPDGQRNTPTLLGVGETLALHWSGDLDELQDVESTIRITQAGTGLAPGDDNCTPSCDTAPPNAGRSRDLDDLAVYMASLQLPPNPYLENGALSSAAQAGKALFESTETGCADCHVPPLYTDGLVHDVGTGDGLDERKGPAFNTPSLRGLYKTAPYLHHGAAATLRDVITTGNPEDRHGRTTQLSAGELDQLVAYLASIEGGGFSINAGLNDAWYDPATSGQGFFVTVYPTRGKVFLAWFTFDVEPADGPAATLGDAGHRWLTALGDFEGGTALLEITLTTGGLFDDGDSDVERSPAGQIELEFSGCNAGTVTYRLLDDALTGVVPIERVNRDNVALCEALRER